MDAIHAMMNNHSMNPCEQNVIWTYVCIHIVVKVTKEVKDENIDHHHPTRHGDAMMPGMRAASSRTSQPSACQTRGPALQITSGIRGYSIELAHKGGDTGMKTQHNRMHRKAQPAAGASTRLRPASATCRMPIGHLFSLVLLMLMGLLCVGAGHAPEMYNNGQGTAG
jgi:hypothetical protein